MTSNLRKNGIRLFRNFKNTVCDINHPNIHQENLNNHIFLHNLTSSIGWCVICLYLKKKIWPNFVVRVWSKKCFPRMIKLFIFMGYTLGIIKIWLENLTYLLNFAHLTKCMKKMFNSSNKNKLHSTLTWEFNLTSTDSV